jgi:hypothetical protein
VRDIPAELAARIESGAATLCHVWLLTPRTGARLGFTDHDRDLVLEGVICRAATGWTAGAGEAALSEAGSTAAIGVLDDAGLDAVGLEAGAWDGATVELRRVDWARPDLSVSLSVGRVARVKRHGDRFEAEVEGPLGRLRRVIGRTYGRLCDAELGDARCGVDLGDPAFAGKPCDKRWRTCTGVFANGANFRGFPDVPGDDFLAATPGAGERHDGGSRR